MAEVLDQENKAAEQGTAGTPAFSETTPAPKKKKKNRKKIIKRIIIIAILAALAGGGIYYWKNHRSSDNTEAEVLTDMVSRGSITSVVEGSGAAVAKNSDSVTLLAEGKVREVFVSEGDFVTKGTPLFEIDSSELEDSVLSARQRVRDQERILTDRERDLKKYLDKGVAGDVKAEYDGILIDVKDSYKVGDEVTEKTVFATLADNTTMKLKLYYSYAYDGKIAVGQDATVYIPVTMAQLPGRVDEIHKVDYITPEGGRMFEIVVTVSNPGTLTKDMDATATVLVDGELVYPYAPGKLDYLRTAELKVPLDGKLTWIEANKWQKLATGDSIARIEKDLEDHEDRVRDLQKAVDDAQKSLEDSRKSLEKEEKNLRSLSAVAPIDGTVLSVGIKTGENAKAGTVAVNIADMTTMKIEAQIDEHYIQFVKAGMPVDLKLGETVLYGTVESVSLSAKSENGVARFPITILVDNEDGSLRSNAYVDYSFTASQSDDCLLVPIQCVKSAQTADGQNCKVLFVAEDSPTESTVELDTAMMQIPNGFRPVYVEVGISDNRHTEILSGVEEGTVVYAGVVQNDSMGMMF